MKRKKPIKHHSLSSSFGLITAIIPDILWNSIYLRVPNSVSLLPSFLLWPRRIGDKPRFCKYRKGIITAFWYTTVPLFFFLTFSFALGYTQVVYPGPITSWQIDGETMGTVADFIFLGSKITADGNYSHEIKRCLPLGRKAMTNLGSILKSKDVTLLTKVCPVKAMVFPVVMYGCESWTIKKAEH